MNSSQTLMDVPSAFRTLYWPVAIALAVLLAGLWLAGYGPGASACAVPSAVAEAARVPALVPAQTSVVPPVVTSAAAASGLVVAAPATIDVAPAATPAAAKIYFASGRSEVNEAGMAKAKPIIDYLKANADAKAQISGFHDPRGNKAANEELALNRARAVRALLQANGIGKERAVMAKPVETSGDGPRDEARRVELSVLP